jgi:hypothetical protein
MPLCARLRLCCAWIQVHFMKRKHRKLGNRVQLVVDEVLHLLGHSSSAGADMSRGRRLQLTRLEDRVLMSASPLAMVAEVATLVTEAAFTDSTFNSSMSDAADSGSAESPIHSAVNIDGEIDTDAADSTPAVHGVELIVIDSRVQDSDTLLSQLLVSERDFRFLRLDEGRDGIAQISDRLEQLGDVAAIHLLTHGADGQILLGSTVLNASTLAQYAPDFLAWQHYLTADADLLLYGCDVAETTEGLDFVTALGQLTDTDVAASDDETGAAAVGGDWILEQNVGVIDTSVAFVDVSQLEWQGLLSLDAYESFSYSTGSLEGSNGGTGWATPWIRTAGSSANVVSAGLTAPPGLPPALGGAAEMNTVFIFEQSRDLSVAIGADGTTKWFSFLLEPDGTSLGMSLMIGDGIGAANTVNVGASGSDFLLGMDNTGTGSKITNAVVDDETYFLVVRIDFAAGNDLVRLYLNPTAGLTSPDSLPAATAQLTTADLGTFTRIGMIGGALGNNSVMDEIRIGDTFADVAGGSNQTPTADAGGPYTINEGNSLNLDGSGSSDPDSDPLAYAWDLDNDGQYGESGEPVTQNGTVTWATLQSFGVMSGGTFTIGLQVSDGNGGVNSSTTTLTINNINDAPVMTAEAISLGSIAANQTSSAMPVSTIFGSSIVDPDTNAYFTAVEGIAVTGVTGNGTWQYSFDGSTWHSIPAVAVTQALLLRDTDLLRFVGTGTAAGSASITFAAWDQTGVTAGQQGTTVSLSTLGTGGTSPFSTTSNTATLTLMAANNPPIANDESYTLDQGGTLTVSPFAGWFNPNWQYRQQLVFNNAASSTNLNNAAVLVKLHASAVDAIHIDHSATQNAGEDLRFVDPNGTLLAYEIEQWNESGYSYVWVKVPQIDAGSTTDSIFMYYGNSNAEAAQNAAAVWNSSNVAVFHMNANSSDSTSYANDGSPTSVLASTGQVARSGTFDGLNSSVNAHSAASVDNLFAGGGTISAWINPVSWGEGGYGRIADKGTTTSGAQGWGFQVAGTDAADGYLNFESDFTTNIGRWRTAAGSVAQGSWQNVVLVYDNSSLANVPKIYIDGNQVAVTQMSAPAGTARSDAAQDLYIGNRSGASDRTFSGRIDEIRFSATALTADQIRADYKSVAGTLVSSSGVVAGPGGLLDNDSDPDNDNLTVSIVSGPSHAASFSLNPDGSFNYVHDGSETTTDSFTYRVSDGTSTDTATVLLTITPVNVTPVITSNGGGATAAISVAENSTAVTTVVATDADLPTQSLTYSISGGADASRFSINSATGELILVSAPNFEVPTDNGSNNVYNVNVRVTDGTLTDTQAIAVTVTNVNEPPSMTVTQTVFTLSEDAATSPPIEIGTITISDDALGTNSLTLTGADASSFQIVAGNKLRLKAGTSLNANTHPVLSVTINLSDSSLSGSPISSQTVTLNISDVDEPPTANAGGPYVIAEGDSLTVTAGPSVDPEGFPLTYAWDIDGDGQFDDASGSSATLTWAQLGALSIPINDSAARTVALRVTDAGGNSTTATASLTINETPPTIIVTGSVYTTSGALYTINLAATDPGDDTITSWHINWGDGTIQTVAGTSSTASHTYSVPGGTRSITLTGTDENGTHAMTGGPLVVNVANNAPTAPTLSDLGVPGLTNGANVGILSYTDPDAGDSHTWTVSDNRFTVVGTTLKLKTSQQINPLTEPTVTLTVTVTDAGGLSNASNFTLRINHPPVSVADVYAVDGTQQLSISSPSQGVLANDSDADSDQLTATLMSGPSHAAAFGLNTNGTFWYRAAFGFSGVDTFTYRATDGVNTGAVTTVTVAVNQPATIDYHALIWTIPEHQTLTAPLQVGTVGINDDGIGTNTVTLTGPDAALFELDSSNNLFLKAGVTINFSVQSQFDVTVNIDDALIAGAPDATQRLIFSVGNLNGAPTATALPNVVVPEDAAPGNINTAFAFSDPDSDPLTYSIQVVSQSPGLIRSIGIDQTTGNISYALNADAFGTASLRVVARDPSDASVARQFQLIVQPLSDPPIVRNYFATTFSDEMLIVSGAGVLASATDADFDAMTVALVSAPVNGTVVLNASGGFVYTPHSGFHGVDTFRFVASDGSLASNIGTASITVVPQFFGSQNGSTSGNSSSSGQSSTSASTGTASSSSGTSSAAPVTSGTGNSGSKTPATGGGAGNSNTSGDALLAGMINPALPGSTSPADNESEDDFMGVLPSAETTVVKRILPATERESGENVERNDSNDFARRTSENVSAHDFDAAFTQLEAGDAQAGLNREREILYRQIAERVDSRADSVTEQLEKTEEFKGRVVGSVGVVTTGFSVGYLFWAVRLGTLASGLLAQVPAWSMLDPLLVIDGDQKDDDKESLQNIMDRQQAKLNKTEADGFQADNT